MSTPETLNHPTILPSVVMGTLQLQVYKHQASKTSLVGGVQKERVLKELLHGAFSWVLLVLSLLPAFLAFLCNFGVERLSKPFKLPYLLASRIKSFKWNPSHIMRLVKFVHILVNNKFTNPVIPLVRTWSPSNWPPACKWQAVLWPESLTLNSLASSNAGSTQHPCFCLRNAWAEVSNMGFPWGKINNRKRQPYRLGTALCNGLLSTQGITAGATSAGWGKRGKQS